MKFFDEIVIKSVTQTPKTAVPWYFIGLYAEQSNDSIVLPETLEWLHDIIYQNKDKFEHRYMEYLGTTQYPPHTERALNEIKRIYGENDELD